MARPHWAPLPCGLRGLEQRQVEVGIEGLTERQILSGVAEGEQVVVAGQNRLVDGATVQIAKSSFASTDEASSEALN